MVGGQSGIGRREIPLLLQNIYCVTNTVFHNTQSFTLLNLQHLIFYETSMLYTVQPLDVLHSLQVLHGLHVPQKVQSAK